MKNKILVIALVLLAFGCGVSSNTKDLLNVNFRNTLRDLYGQQGIDITDITSKVVLMDYYKGDGYPYNSKEPGYKGTISCEFKDGNTIVSMWFNVVFDKYWHVQDMPEIYGKNKVDLYVSDIRVSNLNDFKDAMNFKDAMKSQYILERFGSLDNRMNAINAVRKAEGKEPL